MSASWTAGEDIRVLVQTELTTALRRAGVFGSEASASGPMARYVVQVEMHRRDPSGSGRGAVEGAVSVLDRQRNLIVTTFRIRRFGRGDDPRSAVRGLSEEIAKVLSEAPPLGVEIDEARRIDDDRPFTLGGLHRADGVFHPRYGPGEIRRDSASRRDDRHLAVEPRYHAAPSYLPQDVGSLMRHRGGIGWDSHLL